MLDATRDLSVDDGSRLIDRVDLLVFSNAQGELDVTALGRVGVVVQSKANSDPFAVAYGPREKGHVGL